MRSHVMNFSSSKNASSSSNKQLFLEDSDELQSIHSSSSSRGEEENPTTSPELISFVLQDGESETESLAVAGYARRRRQKRCRKTRVFSSEIRVKKSPEFGEINEEQSPLSSVSDTTTEEDVAHCLMMLSRDQWERENESDRDGGDDSEDSSAGHVVKVMKRANKVGGKYKCETCNKLFKSYQALGGHRASYKKIKADVAARPSRSGGRETAAVAEEKVHECPFCHRVFASGQALGGHKRSHFMGASNVSTFKNVVSRNVENLDIDLNLPAPVDDDDGINFSKQ